MTPDKDDTLFTTLFCFSSFLMKKPSSMDEGFCFQKRGSNIANFDSLAE